MEDMVDLFGRSYQGRKVFVTGHTGFKGSWLCLWLESMGAIVKGYSLSPPTNPSHFDLLQLDMESVIADIRDRDRMQREMVAFGPEIVFHLAAQPLVRLSYQQPVETFDTNIMGTVNVLECCRMSESVRSVVVVTSDKCYDNKEWLWGYRENEAMGGYDPYSSSKGCAELVTAAYRSSFFHDREFGKTHQTLVASARAGNVIGGGDWALDRLVPDIMKATSRGERVTIRNPHSTRPWQHVLEPLSGYLLLGQKLYAGAKECASAWNFGPSDQSNLSVEKVVTLLQQYWDQIDYSVVEDPKALHEARQLQLDCTKAHHELYWFETWDHHQVFEYTANWYRRFYQDHVATSRDDLADYVKDARSKQLSWTQSQ